MILCSLNVQSRTTTDTLFLENISLYFVLHMFILRSFFSFFYPSSHTPFHTFIFERDCTPLQCFYKGCIQLNQQLALSRLMHSIHCGSAIFPYQALERRPVQETLIGCAGLHSIKNSKALEHSSYIMMCCPLLNEKRENDYELWVRKHVPGIGRFVLHSTVLDRPISAETLRKTTKNLRITSGWTWASRCSPLSCNARLRVECKNAKLYLPRFHF
jgi:hypothetical protein